MANGGLSRSVGVLQSTFYMILIIVVQNLRRVIKGREVILYKKDWIELRLMENGWRFSKP